MAKHTLKLVHLTLDGKWTKTIDEKLQVATRVAARAWLKAIALKVPVWTGQARGGFAFAEGSNGFLGQFLNLSIPINPTHPKVGKNAQTGGEQARYSFTSGQHKYQFYFRSDVVEWSLNEFFYSATKPQYLSRPWNLRFQGSQAYKESIADSLKRMPKVKSGIVKVVDVSE